MFHSVMSGSDKINAYYKGALEAYANKMPKGKFMNLHDFKEDSCLGIALLVNGDIVALHKMCSLNKLTDKQGLICLTRNSVGGNFHLLYTGWEDSIKEYNNSLWDFCGDKAICAYYIFEEEPEKTDNNWVDHIDLPDDNGGWVDHIDLPDDGQKDIPSINDCIDHDQCSH